MKPGMALLVIIGVLALLIVGLFASGIVKINVEVHDEDDEKVDWKEIKALDDSTWRNRLLKWLARLYEKILEIEKKKAEEERRDKGDDGDDGGES